jgi:hypothetical protein
VEGWSLEAVGAWAVAGGVTGGGLEPGGAAVGSSRGSRKRTIEGWERVDGVGFVCRMQCARPQDVIFGPKTNG